MIIKQQAKDVYGIDVDKATTRKNGNVIQQHDDPPRSAQRIHSVARNLS
jgi:hypothetical protein